MLNSISFLQAQDLRSAYLSASLIDSRLIYLGIQWIKNNKKVFLLDMRLV